MNVQKPRICIISFSNLASDPRVRRQIKALKNIYEITTLGREKSNVQTIKEFIITDTRSFLEKLKSRLIFSFARFFNFIYFEYIRLKYPTRSILELLKKAHFDVVIANNLDALVLAIPIIKRDKAKLLFDAHEYEPRRIEDHWFHKLFVNPYKNFLCREYLPFVDAMTTVSNGIANEFNRVYGIKPEVIMNTPEYKEVETSKVDPGKIAIVHIGVAHPSRKIEEMLKILTLLDEKFYLTLILVVNNKGYFNKLVKLGDKICHGRVTFRPPVPFDDIVVELSQYDMGLIFYNPTSYNIKYSLPNKFFEYIMAGLALAIGPSPEMKKIIEEFRCGFVADSFRIDSIAEMLNSLTIEDLIKKKKASLKASKVLNAGKEMKKFNKIVKNLIGD